MKDNISPEEKLLRLIRNGKKQNKPAGNNLAAVLSAPAPLPDTKPASKSPKIVINPDYFSFPFLRKAVLAVFIISTVFLIASLVYPLLGLTKVKIPQIEQEVVGDKKTDQQVQVRPYEEYLAGIQGRQIFSASTVYSQSSAGGVSGELVKDINLVGIISGDNPQAIIEDKKAQKTYYLFRGQFAGEFQVDDIQEGKVILNYKGQKFELYL